jgi:hypothetical protein
MEGGIGGSCMCMVEMRNSYEILENWKEEATWET